MRSRVIFIRGAMFMLVAKIVDVYFARHVHLLVRGAFGLGAAAVGAVRFAARGMDCGGDVNFAGRGAIIFYWSSFPFISFFIFITAPKLTGLSPLRYSLTGISHKRYRGCIFAAVNLRW